MLISGNWHREVVRRRQAVALPIVRFADMRFTYGTGQRFGSLGNSFSPGRMAPHTENRRRNLSER